MSILTIHQLERISALTEQIIVSGSPKDPRIRRICVKLARLDQEIAKKKSEGTRI